jgi:aminomethyltransferase
MLSYHADADIHTNPFELGMDRLVDLDMEADFIGKAALRRIRADGVRRLQVGLRLDCAPLSGPNTTFWNISRAGEVIGKVTSAIYSPRLSQNIALAMMQLEHSEIGTKVEVHTKGGTVAAVVVPCPFYDPGKKLTSASTSAG